MLPMPAPRARLHNQRVLHDLLELLRSLELPHPLYLLRSLVSLH
jgi:hypothetical protein